MVRSLSLSRLGLLFSAVIAGCYGQSFTSGTVTYGSGAVAGSPYPSTVSVSAVSGAVSTVTVKINNFTGNGPGAFVGDFAWVLQDNLGHQFVLWATDTCDATMINNVTFTVSDAGTQLAQNNYTVTNNGTFKPFTNCGRGGGSTTSFPGGVPNPPASAYAGTVGSATFTSIFGNGNNTNPNGTWSLYTFKDSFDGQSGSFTWTLNITAQNLTTPSISLSPSIASPILTTQSPTFTATVSNSGTPVTSGTVTFTYDNNVAIGSAVALNGSGQAMSSSVSFPEGTHIVKAAYSGGGTFGPANTTITYVVNHPTTQVGNSFCNTGGVTLNPTQNLTGTPYPSNIVVGPPTGSNLTGAVSSVTMQLTNASAVVPVGMELLLVDPAGHLFIPLQETGSVTAAATNITFTLADSAGSAVPNPWVPGTFSPTANPPLASWPAPAPSATSGNAAAPSGTTSFASAFGGDTPNGTWSLYPITGAFGFGSASSLGGWCLNITTSGNPPSTTTVTSSQNPTLQSTNVTITATVKDAGTQAVQTSGTVTFKEGTTTLASNVTLNGSGQASFTYSSAVEGDHFITAFYSGATDAPSTSAPFDQRVNHPTTNPSSGVYCNTGSITLPNTGSAPFDASPYPSEITLPFIPGQVSSFTVSAKGITAFPQTLGLLLTSPNGSPVQNLVLMQNQGGNTTEASNINITIGDSGAAFPANLTSSGTFKPSSASTPETFSYPSPAPAAVNLVFPAPQGTATMASAFNGSFQGIWSLFSNIAQANPGESISGGWCMNLTVTPPVASAVKAAVGAPFAQGQQGVSYTVTVTNNGPGSSGDSTGANPVTVVDTLPSGLTPATVPGSGSGWTCPAAVGQVITCTNSNIVSSGSSYPVLTLFANVATNATSPLANHATISGGGFASVNSNTTSTVVNAAPVLSVSKTSVGTFTQGSTAEWDVTVSNTGVGSNTSGTTTVIDTLPTGYTVANFSNTSATWTCGSVTVTVTCTSTQVIAGGSSFPVIKIVVNVPGASPTSVTNNVVTFGGGDLTHTNSGNGATAFSTISVVQVPASITINGGQTQSTAVSTAFGIALAVTVKDANGVVINNSPVTFTASTGGNGQSGTFSNSSGTIIVNTNASGVATAGTITANTKAGAFTVTVTDGSAPSQIFNLTNLAGGANTVAVSSGSGQSATVSTAFTNPLVALVTDANGNPVSGVVVTFTAPVQTGASATFAGNVITATTNASGLATSAAVSANSHAGGPYNVVASAPGAGTSANFSLTNVAGTAATVAVSSGSGQSAPINTAFTNKLVALVTDAGGNPVSGVVVTFTAPPQTGASATFAGNLITATTNGSGLATSAVVSANGHAGGPYNVVASAPGAGTSANFALTNVAGAAATVAVSSGSGQSAAINTAFTSPLVALVTDAGGNPVSGVVVTFTAPAQTGPSATFAGNVITATTNASGLATSAVVSANSHAGVPYTIVASAPGAGTSANFALTNLAGAAATVAVSSGSGQSATINTAFTNKLVALVTDAGGNPVSGVVVTFTAPAQTIASATFAGNVITGTTNGSGLATSAVVSANGHAGGPYNVVASAPGAGTSANFALTNLAGSAATVAVSSGSGQSAQIGAQFTNPLVALVTDSGGNPVSGVVVTFTAPAQTVASATFAGNVITATTNASGLATSAVVSANTHAGGPYNVVASAPGAGTSANFVLTNLAGAAGSITVSSGSGQSATINTAFTNPLVALVTDSGGNPVSGVLVTFTAPAQTVPSATFAANVITATTNAAGLATSAVVSANSHAGGPYNVVASAPGAGTPANFSLTNLTGTASTVAVSSGSGQSAQIGTQFTNPLVALVSDSGGNPVSGVVVTFTAPVQTGPSATFAGGTITATTNASGLATSVALTANTHAGSPYNVVASAPGAGTSANFALTNLSGTAGGIVVTSGNNQSTQINQPFANPLVATVTDSGGNPVAGAVVTFTAPAQTAPSATFAGGTITATTNGAGIATSVILTANSHAGGPYTVAATTPGAASPANFSLTNLVGPVANIAVSSGSPQSTVVSTNFGAPLVALVTDAGGNPVSGVQVTFTPVPVAGASASLSSPTANTGADGLASVMAMANATAGSYTVTASASGAPTPATFNLTNTVGAAVVTNVTSTTANGTYGIGTVIPITVTFSRTVTVTGTPLLTLNSGGTASYTSGSGTSNLTFTYTVAPGNGTLHLDASSSTALTLNGGTIVDSSTANAVLTLPVGSAPGSLFSNKMIAIDTISPTVVSYSVQFGTQIYNVIGSPRNRLPWQITGIQVVFSKPITVGDINSLTGLPTTGFTGLGTNTLTWTITATPIGSFATMLQGSGPDMLQDAEGNALAGGAGFAQNLKILWGDFNDDGVVNSSDLVQVSGARTGPYNVFADLNGDGVVDGNDVAIARARIGSTLP